MDTGWYGNRFAGGASAPDSWTGWGNLGGLAGDKGSCDSNAFGQLVRGVFAVTDSALWVDVFNGISWSGFARLGSTDVGNSACIAPGGGKALCTVVSVNNRVPAIVGT